MTRTSRRLATALAGVATLVVSLLGAAPAHADATRTVTATVSPAKSGQYVAISCLASHYSDYGATGDDGKVVFTGVPADACVLQALGGNPFTDPYIVFMANAGGATVASGSVPNGTGDEAVTLSGTGPIGIGVPVCSTPGSVTGQAVVGKTLTGIPGTFAGIPPGFTIDPSWYTYDWFRIKYVDGYVKALPVQTSAPGHNKSTYTVRSADQGWQIAVLTSINPFGVGGAPGVGTIGFYCSWLPTGAVTGVGTTAPTSAPVIKGGSSVGSLLRASTAGVPAGTTTSFAWYRTVQAKNGKATLKKIAYAKRSVYRVRPADKGKRVFVAITYTQAPYDPTTALSGGKKIH